MNTEEKDYVNGGYIGLDINHEGRKTNFGDLVTSCKEFSVTMEDIQINLCNFRVFLNGFKYKLPRKLKKRMFGTRSSRRRNLAKALIGTVKEKYEEVV